MAENGGRFSGQPGKPALGTAEHHDWLEGEVRAYVLEVPKPTRRGFVLWTRGRRWTAASKDFERYPGGWSYCLERARGGAPGFVGFDLEDVPDTADVPMDPIPDEWEARRLKTKVDEDGNVKEQWIAARPEAASAQLVEERPDGHRLRGVSTLVSGDGKILNQWIKTDRDADAKAAFFCELCKDLPALLGDVRAEPIEPPEVAWSDLLAVYPIGDAHFALLTHAAETGEDWCLAKAEAITVAAMRDLVQRGPRTKQAILLNLGDYYHADDSTNRTRRSGHALYTDATFKRSRRAGIRALVSMIRLALEHHDEVIVRNLKGNHDDDSADWLDVALALYFEHEPRVVVSDSEALHEYHRHGKVLLGMTHGHTSKPEDLGAIMASEQPEAWGQTRHRHWLCGHLHHKIVSKDTRGCTVEVFRVLGPRTKYEAGLGLRAARDMNRITYHAEWGEVSREIVSAQALMAQLEQEAA